VKWRDTVSRHGAWTDCCRKEGVGDQLPLLPGAGCLSRLCFRVLADRVAALAPSERRPAQQPFWTQAEGAAKRSGAAPRPGNEVFALLGRTGTGHCPVAVSGTALQLLGACRTKPGGGHALASGYKRHARWQTLPDREGRTKPTLTQGVVDAGIKRQHFRRFCSQGEAGWWVSLGVRFRWSPACLLRPSR